MTHYPDLDPDVLEREAGISPPPFGPSAPPPNGTDQKTEVTIRPAAQFRVEPIRWVWNGWIAGGKVHILAGAPGTGKTSLSMAMAATITLGGRWPDGTTATPGDVVIWSGEDDPSDTLIPRLMAAGADLSRALIVTSAVDRKGDNDRARAFDPATDITALADTLGAMDPPPALLIIDPIVSAVAGDSHKNAEVRRALQPLVDLAMARRVAVLGITHFSKGSTGRDPVERVTGSLAFGALARIVMAAAKRSDEEGGGRILARGKSNIGRDDGGFIYNLEVTQVADGIETTRVTWGEPLEGSARDLLSTAETATDPEDRSAVVDAMEWLRDQLRFGSIEGAQVKRLAKAEGISERTLYRAADTIGVVRRGNGFGKSRMWSLMCVMPAKSAGSGNPADMDDQTTMRAMDPNPADMANMRNHGTHGQNRRPDGTHGTDGLGTHGTDGTQAAMGHETTDSIEAEGFF